MRRVQTENVTRYVSNKTGDDANDGSSPDLPLRTIARAIDIIAFSHDMAGFSATIKLDDGEYDEGILISGAFLGNAQISVTGNLAAPEKVVVASAAGRSAITVQDFACATFNGMTIAAGPDGNGIVAQKFGIADIGEAIRFGSIEGIGSHIFANPQGRINSLAGYTIAGGAGHHVGINHGVVATAGVAVQIPNPLAFVTFASVQFGGFYQAPAMQFVGAGVAGTTGRRFLIDTCGVIQTNGGGDSYFPGDAAGSIVGGCGAYQ